jgi:lysozyme
MERRRINKSGIDLIKQYEGLRLAAYLCPGDVWTIGYGHTGPEVKKGLFVTAKRAEELLQEDLRRFEDGVCDLVEVEISDNAFSALVSFSFNVGLYNLKRSTMLRLINEGKVKEAADEFRKWTRANGKVLNGLVKRRESERTLFLK